MHSVVPHHLLLELCVRQVKEHGLAEDAAGGSIIKRRRQLLEHLGGIDVLETRTFHNPNSVTLQTIALTPLSWSSLELSCKNTVASYHTLAWCPRHSRHCSYANMTRLVINTWSSTRRGFERSHAMYFCHRSSWKRINNPCKWWVQ